MNAGKQISLGLGTYFKGIGFIFRNGLWWFFLFPLAFNLLLFFGGAASISGISDIVMDWLQPWISFENNTFWGAETLTEYLPGIVQGVMWVILKVSFFFLFAYFGGYIVLILLSPVLAYLSEKTEMILTGNEYPFSAVQTMRDAIRGVGVALRNLLIEVVWMVGLFIITFIPVVGFVTPFVGFAVSSYFYGFSYMDYYNERRRMKMGESIRFIRKYKWLAVIHGATFALCMLIPFCGVSLAGFAAIISCVGSTLAMHELLDKGKHQQTVEAKPAKKQLKTPPPAKLDNNDKPPRIDPAD